MRRLWRHKWVVAVSTLALVLTIGTVAWAAAPQTNETGTGVAADDRGVWGACVARCAAAGDATRLGDCAAWLDGEPGAGRLKERLDQMKQRRDAVMKLVREKMTAEDQAKYDELVAKAQDQQEALKSAREALRDTVQQLRQLTDKYLTPDERAGDTAGTTGPAATGAQ